MGEAEGTDEARAASRVRFIQKVLLGDWKRNQGEALTGCQLQRLSHAQNHLPLETMDTCLDGGQERFRPGQEPMTCPSCD